MKYTYFYLHTNRKLLEKSPLVVESDPEYFHSPFVQKWWKVNYSNINNVIDFLSEASRMYADNITDVLKYMVIDDYITDEDSAIIIEQLQKLEEI